MRIFLMLSAVVSLAAESKPNILFILADDQRFDTIRALGNKEIKTPTLDRLVGRGMSFTNVYCQGSMVPAVCTPSRTMILTGRSLFRIPKPQAKSYDGPTLGGTFRDAGYATLCVSKPGNSFAFGHSQFEKNVPIPHSGAATSRKCVDAVIDYLPTMWKEKPFFIYLAPSVPHDPRTAEEEFQKLYDPATLTLSKNFMPSHPFDNGELSVRDEKLAPLPRTESEMKKHLTDYYACISGFDHHLGRLMAALEKEGRLKNTIVVFTSDQGLAVGGRHGLMGKQNLYEHFKSPLVIAGPGIEKGNSDALVYLFDLFPTLCETAGITVPGACEGKSLLPLLRGNKAVHRPLLFTAYRDAQRMVRDERWKLIQYPKIERLQLFNLEVDPDELNDLSANKEQVATMKAKLREQQKAWSDPLVK